MIDQGIIALTAGFPESLEGHSSAMGRGSDSPQFPFRKRVEARFDAMFHGNRKHLRHPVYVWVHHTWEGKFHVMRGSKMRP
jgi:hypothetical protein